MSPETLRTTVNALVQRIVGAERMPHVEAQYSFAHDLGVDSLELLEIVMEAEDLADVIVPEEYFEALFTTDDLVHTIGKLVENRNSEE